MILALSRKGGVGKTSVLLSAAIQLADQGRRVAYVDLDTQGTHLSQFLPLDQDMQPVPGMNGDTEYKFCKDTFIRAARKQSGAGCPIPEYGYRPAVQWHMTNVGRPKGYVFPFGEMVARLAIGSSFREKCGAHRLRVKRVVENLGLFLCSCYLSDLDRLNEMQLSADGQEQYRNRLSAMIDEFSREGFEYVLIDNSPGLSLSGANTFAWALEWLHGGAKREVYPWILSHASWWEQGLIFYETNVYNHVLIKSFPTVIVNRVFKSWLGFAEFSPGTRVPLNGANRGLVKRMAAEALILPLWLNASSVIQDDSSLEKFIPNELSLVVLGDDPEVRNSMVRPQDDQPIERASGRSVTEDLDEFEGQDESAERFHLMTTKFLRGFLLPAIGLTSDPFDNRSLNTQFHAQVRTALIEPMLAPDGAR
ncbi:MAG TPA: AAA family ATPase [Gemmataceae bacterium]|nr:AAA family ATPase [Gemmataceae bacterium]